MSDLSFTIRGITVEANADFTDHDIMALVSLSNLSIDASTSRRNAAFAINQIFPDAPAEWTKDGICRLNNYELLPVISRLTAIKEALPELQESLRSTQTALQGSNPELAAELGGELDRIESTKGKGFGKKSPIIEVMERFESDGKQAKIAALQAQLTELME